MTPITSEERRQNEVARLTEIAQRYTAHGSHYASAWNQRQANNVLAMPIKEFEKQATVK